MWSLLLCLTAQAQVPTESAELVAVVTPSWDSSRGTLQRWRRPPEGAWSAVGPALPVRLGREGLAWGLGLHPVQPGEQKREGDWRSPAGLFLLGRAYADPPVPVAEHAWPTQQVTSRDLWVEDPAAPTYNTHVQLPGERPLTPWEQRQRMRMGDPAHRLKIVVEHNTSDPVPGAGSAIFLHIWRRGGEPPTSGCTAMAEADLRTLHGWLSVQAKPVLALLPASEWATYAAAWHLPPSPLPETP